NNMVIAIGASTGGTEAILEVVRDLPATTPGIVIVQHMPAGFTKMYAERLDKHCKMRVKEAENGDRVQQGQIIIGAGEFHLRLAKDMRGYYVTSQRGEKVSGHCPSVDVLFDSVAEVAKGRSLGVILTGMGADGAKGLLAMRKSGAYTIGQDKDSCIVYGMPMVAFNIGGVIKQAPLTEIDNEIERYLNGLK
ncbi:MAG: CheB methylesterase domain-containing protein, partial [Oscillospiraceae bacterium]